MSSTDIVAAFAALRGRAETLITSVPLFWQDEENELPDDPASFLYFELETDRGDVIEIGGGRGANRHRHWGEFNGYLFVPRGKGLPYMLGLAEPIAAVFRSFRGGGVSCSAATVHPVAEGESLVPPGVRSAAGRYSCVMINIPLYYDQIA